MSGFIANVDSRTSLAGQNRLDKIAGSNDKVAGVIYVRGEAITRQGDELIQIIDVERILSEFVESHTAISTGIMSEQDKDAVKGKTVLVADDSKVARNQLAKALTGLGVNFVMVEDGQAAIDWLLHESEQYADPIEHSVPLVISDIEMPRMDGYTVTRIIKEQPKLKNTHVILHSSVSGEFNESMVERVGANSFLSKFNPDELGQLVKSFLIQRDSHHG